MSQALRRLIGLGIGESGERLQGEIGIQRGGGESFHAAEVERAIVGDVVTALNQHHFSDDELCAIGGDVENVLQLHADAQTGFGDKGGGEILMKSGG